MPKSPSPTLFIVDQLIRSGNLAKARKEVLALAKHRIPREQLAPVAILAWRLHLAPLGVRLLNKLVRPSGRGPKTAGPQERAAYAACLVRLGAIEEAQELLGRIDDKEVPQALFFRASVQIAKWEYGEAIPLLARYIEKTPDAYQRTVGEVNLAAALVYEHQPERARELLERLLDRVTREKLTLLYGNLVELSALNAMLSERWEDAERALRDAERVPSNESGMSAFLVRKWKAVLEIMRRPPSTETLHELAQVREQAIVTHHWETVRDCDHFRAVATHDEKLLTHVYCGSPQDRFRRALLADYKGEVRLPTTYRWQLLGSEERGRTFSLVEGKDSLSRAEIKTGNASHRLLSVLCSDFYRPLRMATLHARLYPGEYYNPDSSPLRVRQAIKRLRTWFQESRVPLVVVESGGQYHLSAMRQYGVIIPLVSSQVPDRLSVLLEKLRASWPEGTFSSKDAEKVLARPGRTVRRVLEKALAEGALVREGSGPMIRYRFAIAKAA